MKTRNDMIFKWSIYSALVLLVLLVQKLLLPQLRCFGVGLFLPPMIAAMLAAFEPQLEGMLFALGFGIVCDLALMEHTPCFYTIAFVLAAILAERISEHLLNAQLLCSAAVSAAAYLVCTLLHGVLLCTRGAAIADVLLQGGKELLLAMPFVVPLHFLFAFFHKRFHFYD